VPPVVNGRIIIVSKRRLLRTAIGRIGRLHETEAARARAFSTLSARSLLTRAAGALVCSHYVPPGPTPRCEFLHHTIVVSCRFVLGLV
jgi:hypothetical protein